ncbi:hypothetical protein BMS3Bbin02_00024 [bacterium BMS3Bbin02]|nr:hypothetical protein BMS3Bbin02_00024 [bacterium BMS3Bbin02]
MQFEIGDTVRDKRTGEVVSFEADGLQIKWSDGLQRHCPTDIAHDRLEILEPEPPVCTASGSGAAPVPLVLEDVPAAAADVPDDIETPPPGISPDAHSEGAAPADPDADPFA